MSTNMASTVSKNIRKIRKEKGISQDRLSKEADLALNTVAKIETGESLNPTVETLQKIANALGVSYSERGAKTKQDEILKAIKRKGIAITEEQLERAFRVFENSPFIKGCHSEGMTGYLKLPFVKGCHSEGMTGYLKLPYNPKLKEKARELRKAGNLSEVLLWNNLKQKKMLGFDFTRQQIIGNYIVDFHCPKLRLVIEIDGESHDFKGEYDEKRDKYLQSLGLTVLHFKDIDIKNSLNEVLTQMESWVKINTPSALQTPLLEKGELSPKYQHLP